MTSQIDLALIRMEVTDFKASAQTSSDYYVGTGVLAFKSHTRTTLSR